MINKLLLISSIIIFCAWSAGVNSASGVSLLKASNNIKNGPLTLNDKQSFLLPDKFKQLKENGIAVDSYGNLVTPLPPADNDVLSRTGSFKDSNGFAIPPYASGIDKLVDPNLPIVLKKKEEQETIFRSDLDSFAGPAPQPQASSTSMKVDQSQLPSDALLRRASLGNCDVNEIIIPINGLLPPFGPNGPRITFAHEQAAPIIIIKPPPPKTVTTTEIAKTTRPQVVFGQSPQVLRPPQVQQPRRDRPSVTPTYTQQKLQNVATTVTVKKYTGGFGGPSGFLTPQGDNGKVTRPSVLISNPNQQLPSVQSQSRFDSTVSKYIGGFGGPPGLLVPFDQISTFARVGEQK